MKTGAGLSLILVFFLLALPLRARAESIFIVSDLHLRSDTSERETALSAICEAAKGHDLVLVLGDMANSGRPGEHAAVRRFLARLEAEAGAPALVLPGNHDLSGGFSPGDFRAFYADYGYDLAFSFDPSCAGYAAMTPGGLCLFMLDVNDYRAESRAALHGGVREETLSWMEGVLRALPEGTRSLCCGHYPLLPFSGSGSDDTANAEALAGLLASGGIPLYLAGHRHGNSVLRHGALTQILVGVPFAYPAWAGVLRPAAGGLDYSVQPLFPEESEEQRALASASLSLAQRMAEGSLAGTASEGDPEAVAWFVRVYVASLAGTLLSQREELRSLPGYAKWQEAAVRSMAKPWILSLVDNPPADVRHVFIDNPGGL